MSDDVRKLALEHLSAAPAQAQHSSRVFRESFTIDEVLVKYQELRAHAQRLADALRATRKEIRSHNKTITNRVQVATRIIDEALAEADQ